MHKQTHYDKTYVRSEKIPVAEILPHIGVDKTIEVFGIKVRTRSLRLRTFKASTVCVRCGVEGTYFTIDRDRKGFETKQYDNSHLNLYGLNEHGHERMLTKDHILPKSKGGPNTLANLQTMCDKCNRKKGNMEEHEI